MDPLKIGPVRFCFLKNWFPFPFLFAGLWVCPSAVGVFDVLGPLSLMLVWVCVLVPLRTSLRYVDLKSVTAWFLFIPACTWTVRLCRVRTAATYFENFDQLLGNLTYVLSTDGFPKIVKNLGREKTRSLYVRGLMLQLQKLGLSTYDLYDVWSLLV